MRAYKGFELFTNSLQMYFKMHLGILSCLFIVQFLFLLYQEGMHLYKMRNQIDRAFKKAVKMQELTNEEKQLPKRLLVSSNVIWGSCLIYLFYPVIIFLFRRGTQGIFREKIMRGARIVKEREFSRLISSITLENSLPIGCLKLPIEYEIRNLLLTGTVGVGKTVFLCPIIEKTRQRNQKNVLHDVKGGDITSKFYDPEKDIIVNPFDERGVYWNIFDCMETQADFKQRARAIIPEGFNPTESFFNDTASDVLAVIFELCYLDNQKENKYVDRYLKLPISKLHDAIAKLNEKTASYIKGDNPQTQGIISSLNRYVNIFQYMSNTKGRELYLKEWINKDDGGFIFLLNNRKQREILKGIFTCLITTLSDEILTLEDNLDRRIFMTLDEFGMLNKISAVEDMLTLGRSKGLCFFLACQGLQQITKTYGKEMGETIVNLCNTNVILRVNDFQSAKFFSQMLGDQEAKKMQSGYQASVESYREGESYQEKVTERRIVTPTEIMNLRDLEFYLKMPGMPVVKSSLEYKKYPAIAPGFVPSKDFLLSQDQEIKSAVNQ